MINIIAKNNYVEIIRAKTKIVYFKLDIQRVLNSLKICLKKIDNKNIIYIKRDNDINNKIDKDIEVDINGNEIDFLYIINKDIISHSR